MRTGISDIAESLEEEEDCEELQLIDIFFLGTSKRGPRRSGTLGR